MAGKLTPNNQLPMLAAQAHLQKRNSLQLIDAAHADVQHARCSMLPSLEHGRAQHGRALRQNGLMGAEEGPRVQLHDNFACACFWRHRAAESLRMHTVSPVH